MIAFQFMTLSSLEQEFFYNLVGFGGACTARDIQRALKISDRGNANRKIQSLVQQGFLITVPVKKIKGFHMAYFPKPGLSKYLGCERRIPSDTKVVFEKCFRFLIAELNKPKAPQSIYHPTRKPQLSEEALEHLRQNKRDEVIIGDTVLVDLHYYWSLQTLHKKLGFWVEHYPQLKIEVWTDNKYFVENIFDLIPKYLHKPITRIICIPDPFSKDKPEILTYISQDNS